MATHSLAIYHALEAAGMDKKHAEAIANVFATHTDENFATKADIARLEGEIKTIKSEIRGLTSLVKLNLALTVGLYVGLAVLFVDKLAG